MHTILNLFYKCDTSISLLKPRISPSKNKLAQQRNECYRHQWYQEPQVRRLLTPAMSVRATNWLLTPLHDSYAGSVQNQLSVALVAYSMFVQLAIKTQGMH